MTESRAGLPVHSKAIRTYRVPDGQSGTMLNLQLDIAEQGPVGARVADHPIAGDDRAHVVDLKTVGREQRLVGKVRQHQRAKGRFHGEARLEVLVGLVPGSDRGLG